MEGEGIPAGMPLLDEAQAIGPWLLSYHDTGDGDGKWGVYE